MHRTQSRRDGESMHACELTRSIRRYTAPRPLLLPLESRTWEDTMPPAACHDDAFGEARSGIGLQLSANAGSVAHMQAGCRLKLPTEEEAAKM